jgi:hypothetical protein
MTLWVYELDSTYNEGELRETSAIEMMTKYQMALGEKQL